MDPVATYLAAKEAVEHARSGDGPVLLECVTFRTLGHVLSDKNEYMDQDMLAEQIANDPVPRFRAWMISEGVADDGPWRRSTSRCAARSTPPTSRRSPIRTPTLPRSSRTTTARPRSRMSPVRTPSRTSADVPQGHQPGDGPGTRARRSGVRPGRGRRRLRRRRRVPRDGRPVGQARRGPRAQHADLRGSDHGRQHRRCDRRDAPGARDHVHGLPRRGVGPAGQPRRQAPLHVGRSHAGADHRARQHGRRNADRRTAQPVTGSAPDAHARI